MKHEIVWVRARSRVEGENIPVTLFIAAVPGGHLVSTDGPGAPGLCFVPGKAKAVKKLLGVTFEPAAKGKKREKREREKDGEEAGAT